MTRWVGLLAAGALLAGTPGLAMEREDRDRDRQRDQERQPGNRLRVPGFLDQTAYYFLPSDFDKDTTYPLFLVFKVRGSGEEYGYGWRGLTDEVGCVVATMNLPISNYWYSSPRTRDKPHQRVAGLYKLLRKKFKLAPRMFIATEENGARVMQEFAFTTPTRPRPCLSRSSSCGVFWPLGLGAGLCAIAIFTREERCHESEPADLVGCGKQLRWWCSPGSGE